MTDTMRGFSSRIGYHVSGIRYSHKEDPRDGPERFAAFQTRLATFELWLKKADNDPSLMIGGIWPTFSSNIASEGEHERSA